MAFAGYAPPPVRASQSGPPSYLETMTYTLFEVAGVPLRVHALFPIFLAVKTFIGLAYFGFRFAMMTFLLDGPILFASVLVHELCHCAVAHYYGATISHLSLWPLGGLSYVGHSSSVSEETLVALAGPLSHIPQGLFWLVLGAEMVPVSALTTTPSGATTVNSSDYAAIYQDFWLQLCSFALLLQFLLFWLNLTVPVYPLDGGRLMVATLSHLGVGLESAAYIVAGLGLACGGFVLLYGLLASATTAAFGVWIIYEAYGLRRKAASGEADYHPLFAHYTGGPPSAQRDVLMPFDSRGGGGPALAAAITLDDLADSLQAKCPAGDAPALFRWAEHERVYLLRFPDRGAQSAALSRLSVFLEDAGGRGRVEASPASARTAGVAAYSGHNCRASDAARFFNTARDSAVALSLPEEALRSLLLANRLLLPSPDGRVTGAPSLCLLSLPRGLARAEALSTLLHEAMHGLFYTSEPFAAAARAFFQALSQQQQSLWRSFLTTLGYDAANEELVVNEFQAYMSTERELFGAAGAPSGGPTQRRGRGGASAEVVQALSEIQRQWASAMGKHVPLPAPRVAGCACVFMDCGDGGNPGPFRLKGHKQ